MVSFIMLTLYMSVVLLSYAGIFNCTYLHVTVFFYYITSRFEFCGSQIYMKKSITFCEDAYRCMTFADVS